MKKQTRRTIFISLIIVFLVITPWLVLRAQGIRFDFEKKKFVKTGGIFINVLNQNVKIYLEGKLKKSTNLLSNSVFIKNLLPKKYKVEVKKTGYFSWQKNLEVKEGLVTEAKNLILFKKNLQFQVLAEEVEDFLLSEDGGELLIKKGGQNPEILLFNLRRNRREKILKSEDFKGIDLKLLEWDSEKKQILFQKENEKSLNFLVVNYSLFPKIQKTLFSLEKEVKKIILNPVNQNEVIFLKEGNLFSKNFNQRTETLLFPEISWFSNQAEKLYLLTNSGFFQRTKLSPPEREVLNKIPFKYQGKFEIKNFLGKIFLKTEKSLYQLKEGEFEKVHSPVTGFEISVDRKKLAFWGGGEIWLLEKGGESPGNLIFLNRFSENPSSLFWLSPNYLIFNLGAEIKIMEIDKRDLLNLITIKKIKKPKIIFNKTLAKLYILTEEILLGSEKLLP